MNFNDYGFSESILKAVTELGFTEPTEVQKQSFDPVLDGYDVVVQSKTGSGKTAAFGLPLLQILKDDPPGLRAIIMTPTRELAKQVCEDLQSYAKYTSLKFALVYGGVGMEPQVHAISHADVLVGTPGRILDHLSQGTLSLGDVQFLVLDEADRMLDMGFIDDVKNIISAIPADHITMMFSATMPDEVRAIADKMMYEPVFIKLETLVSDALLRQFYIDTENRFKLNTVKEMLVREKPDLAIVFCATRGLTDAVANYLQTQDIEAHAIHGGLTQAKREQVLKGFHAGKVHVLVATDVAARGLDIDNVTHVINYNVPKTVQEYVHRMGRTARAGKEGKVITLLGRDEYEDYGRIDSYFQGKIDKYAMEGFVPRSVTMPRRGEGEGFQGGGRGNFRGGSGGGRPQSSGGNFSRGPRRDGPRDGPRTQSGGGASRFRHGGNRNRAPQAAGSAPSGGERPVGDGERSFYGSKN